MKTDIVSHFIAIHFIVKRILLHFLLKFQKLKGSFLTLDTRTRQCILVTKHPAVDIIFQFKKKY